MKIIYNKLIPFKGFTAINILGFVFTTQNKLSTVVVNHERIHTAQMKEMLYVLFYLWYILEWFIKLFRHGKQAYYNISFEREAYRNDGNLEYVATRKKFGWLRLI